MSAVILSHPAGATRLERWTLSATAALAQWIVHRATRREARLAATRRRLHAERTSARTPHALDYELARQGITKR